MALPAMSQTTLALYNRLPQAWRDYDDAQPAGAGVDHPLARWLSLLFDHVDELRLLLDRFAYLEPGDGGSSSPVDRYALEVEADAPAYFWRLNDPAGTTAFADDVGSDVLAPHGSLTAGAPGLYSSDPDAGSVHLTGGYLAGPTAATLGTLRTFTAVATLDSTVRVAPNNLAGLAGKGGHLGAGWALTVDLAPGVGAASNVTVWLAGVAALSFPWVRDTAEHIWAVTYDGATVRLYLDGNQVATAAGAWAPAEAVTAFTVGVDTPGGPLTWPGSVSEVSYDGVNTLGAGRIATRHTALLTSGGATSDLADPRTAPAAYLSWLAQLVGVNLPASMPVATRRNAVLNPSSGWQAGTKAAIAAAAQTALTGSRYVSVQDHYTGDQWTLALITRADETPGGGASVVAAVDAAMARPAGVNLVSVFYAATWATVETGPPTWATYAGWTWSQVTDIGAP